MHGVQGRNRGGRQVRQVQQGGQDLLCRQLSAKACAGAGPEKAGRRSHGAIQGAAEPLEKGILRQKHNLYAFKDGTIRFDATNEPLTHFKPAWISVSIGKLRELGYTRDYLGRDLVSPDQIVELMMQDVIIPRDSAKHLLNAAKFIDEELAKLYDLEPFYNVSSIDDLVGHMVVGLAPHTSVGMRRPCGTLQSAATATATPTR
jgi:hypothetical protein